MKTNKWWNPINRIILFNTLLCLVLLFSRVIISQSDMYLFLIWNIFLASVPWLISSLFIYRQNLLQKKFLLAIAGFIWILFFPNAPYILTDLFHLKRPSPMPLWFDLSLVLSASWTGLMLGFVSIQHFDFILSKFFSKKLRVITITLVFFISGFGIYLGRYLRWNSWDIVHQPGAFFYNVSSIIFNPFNNLETWAMTLIFGTFLCIIYWSIMLFNAPNHHLKKI